MSIEAQRNDGRAFEDTVARWLSVDGWRIEREQLINYKKVDLLLRREHFGTEWKVAVECKDYARRLDKQKVIKIWAEYGPLVANGSVDEILLVTANGIAPAATAYVKSVRGFRTQELSGILADAIDFSDYLESLVAAYEEAPDGLSHYYVPARATYRRDVESIVIAWIHSSIGEKEPVEGEPVPQPDQPVAILGAYGIGKSSFATKLASSLAVRAQRDRTARIPILIRLGDIAGEQTLEGLLGKHFTATFDVRGYSFHKFRELNKLGRFVVILDGFDEMKQMLSWREFKYNLRQLNQLRDGDSRLIILGRPTAFENDEEHQLALHGKRTGGLGNRQEPGWPDYFEIELSPLEPAEMEQFLRGFLTYRKSPIAENEALFRELWDQVVSKQLRDIARRPVQLGMLAEILPGYARRLDELNVTTVYDIFIDKLIDDIIAREEEKHSRLAFSARERRQFLAEFAFWLWQSPNGSIVHSDQIPLDLVKPFARGEDLEAVRRDLVVGSPLDRRAGERIRFPHRSFQEYLVAEVIWDRLRDGTLNLALSGALVTDEVASFMKMLRGSGEIATALDELRRLRGTLPWSLVDAVLLEDEIVKSIQRRTHKVRPVERRSSLYRPPSPWETLLLSCWTNERGRATHPFDPVDLVTLAQSDGGEEIALMCLFGCLLLGARHWRQPDAAVLDLLAQLLSRETEAARFTNNNINKSGIRRLSGGYVGRQEVRMGRRSEKLDIGRIAGRGKLVVKDDDRRIVGADHLEVRWVSSAVIEVMRRLEIQRGHRRIGLRALRSVFSRHLPESAFIEDWLVDGMLSNSVQLLESVEVKSTHTSLMERVIEFRLAYDELEQASTKTRNAGTTPSSG